jgi:hypothetical protein
MYKLWTYISLYINPFLVLIYLITIYEIQLEAALGIIIQELPVINLLTLPVTWMIFPVAHLHWSHLENGKCHANQHSYNGTDRRIQ